MVLAIIFKNLNQNKIGLTVYQILSKYFKFLDQKTENATNFDQDFENFENVPRRPLASTHGFGSYRSVRATIKVQCVSGGRTKSHERRMRTDYMRVCD